MKTTAAVMLRREKEIQGRLEDMREEQRALIRRYGRWGAFLIFWFGLKFKEREVVPTPAIVKGVGP